MLTITVAFHPFSRLGDDNPIKQTLLEHILSFDGPWLDPDEKIIMYADFGIGIPGWNRKGIPWLEGTNLEAQRLFKRHVSKVLSVNRYFHAEGLKILLRNISVAFTFCAGLGSGLRFMDHVRWSAELELGSEKGCDVLYDLVHSTQGDRSALSHLCGSSSRKVADWEYRSISVEYQVKSDRWQTWSPSPRCDTTRFVLPKPLDQTQGSMILAYNNLAHVEIRWICSRYDPIDGAQDRKRAWRTSTTDDLRNILSYLEIQLRAYPRANALTIDFVGWDHERVMVPEDSHQIERPAQFCGRLSEIVIRGLDGNQQDQVASYISWAVKPNGRIGSTSSHFRLEEGGTLAEVTPDVVVWKKIEHPHPLLEDQTSSLDAVDLNKAR